MDTSPQRRVIDLDPVAVQDDTLAALDAEIRNQSTADVTDVDITAIATLVLDSDSDGLDSHAVIFTDSNTE